MANTIRIARSITTNTPTTLAQGEMANAEVATPNGINELFIGTNGAVITKLVQNLNAQPAQPTAGLTTIAPVTGDYLVFEDVTDSAPKRQLFSAIDLSLFSNATSAFLTSYTETQTLADVTALGATTAVASTFSGGITMSDSELTTPVLTDYGVTHQVATVSANAVTVDLTLGNSCLIDLDPATATTTLTLSNPPITGTYGEVNLTIVMGTPAYAITWPGSVVWQGGAAPTLSTTNDVVDVVHLYTINAGTTWYGTFAVAAAGASGDLAGLTDTTITTPADGALLLYDTGTATWRDAAMGTDATIDDVGALTISADAVTYAKMQNVVADNVFLGNNAGAGAIVDELTGTEATALLDLATISVKGLVPVLPNSASQFLNGTGAFSTPAGSGDVSFDGGIAPADNALVRFDLTTGTIIQESQIIVDDTDNVTGMGTLNTKTIANLVSTTDTGAASWTWIIDEDTMVSDSITHVPTQQSVKAYVDGLVSTPLNYLGAFDPTAGAGAGSPDLDTITSTTGDMYTVTVAGTYNWTTGSAILEVGDVLIAEADGVLNNVASWTIIQNNLSTATETTFGIVEIATQVETDLTTSTLDTHAVTPMKLNAWVIDGGSF